jgi:hypothetical protein
MCKIFIADAIMGKGKTSSAINMMNNDKENNYIFITPYLDEVERIMKDCATKKFSQPENKGNGKLESLHYLLGNKHNIVSTHALFRHYRQYTQDLLKQGNYILILDEVCDVVEQVPLSNSDLTTILQHHAHIEDSVLIWDDIDYKGRFEDIKDMALNKSLVTYAGSILMWNFPVEIFKSFKKAYILTYMFKAQIQKYYYDYYNVEYKYIGVEQIGETYQFVDDVSEDKIHIGNKITILDDDKLNSIGENEYSLSKTWFETEKKTRSKFLLKNLKNNLYNYFINKTKTPSDKSMWTTFKDYKKSLTGKGYTKGFVSVNARATNKFKEKFTLAYCANIFLNPVIKQFFQTKQVKIYENEYALSEMLQWIWRSAIREGNEITIYIPSSRMRGLLKDWLRKTNI